MRFMKPLLFVIRSLFSGSLSSFSPLFSLLALLVLQCFKCAPPLTYQRQLLLRNDPHAPPPGPVVPLERDPPRDQGEQRVVAALFDFLFFCFFFLFRQVLVLFSLSGKRVSSRSSPGAPKEQQ